MEKLYITIEYIHIFTVKLEIQKKKIIIMADAK